MITIIFPTPNGVVGTPYSSSFSASGGTAPYTWSITEGVLPLGLTLNSSTGVVSGIPTKGGSYVFRAIVIDSANIIDNAIGFINIVPEPTGPILAAHTFDFARVYLATRDTAPPGNGAWTTTKIFDGSAANDFLDTFSAGSLLSPRDIIGNDSDKSDLIFAGDGSFVHRIGQNWPGPEAPGSYFQDSLNFWDTCRGGWTFNNAVYLVVPPPTEAKLYIIKTTDNGLTWVNLDFANAPSFSVGPQGAIQFFQNKIYIIGLTGPNYQIAIFDLATETWGVPFADLSESILEWNRNGAWSNGIIPYINGDIGIFYTPAALGNPVYRLWNGSTWSGRINLPGARMAQVVVDANGELVHTLTYTGSSSESSIDYSTCTHAGTVVGPITTIPGTSNVGTDGVGHSAIYGTFLFVPRDDWGDKANAIWVATLPVSQFFKEYLPIPTDENINLLELLVVNNPGSGYVINDLISIDGGIVLAKFTVAGFTPAGTVAQVSIDSAGRNYLVGNGFLSNVGTTATSGVGVGLTLDIQVQTFGLFVGTPTVARINQAGSGYVVGDTGTINGGTSPTHYKVLQAYAGGTPILVAADSGGSGYSEGTNISTTTITGVGVGLTVDILKVTPKFPSCAYMINPSGQFPGGGWKVTEA